MTLKLIVEKVMRMEKKFITVNELKRYCKILKIDYYTAIRYLTYRRYLGRIFRGIFYIYSAEERKLGKSEMNFYYILKEALKIKGKINWYFGLETALKFNNLTHEYFTIDYIINDKIFRAKPMSIMGRKVKFYRLTPKIINFGIIKSTFNYSNPEKTALDLLYLKHYNPGEFKELTKKMSKKKLADYNKKYPRNILEKV